MRFITDLAFLIGSFRRYPLGLSAMTDDKSLLIPVIDIFSCDVVFVDGFGKLFKS